MKQRKPYNILINPGLVFIIILFFSPLDAAASNAALQGKILDRDLNTPIENARISLVNTMFRVQSGSDGSFSIEKIPAGQYRLAVSADGYRDTVITDLHLSPDLPADISIEMEPLHYRLRTIEVKGKRVNIDPGQTRIIDRKIIDKSNARSIPEILSDVEGLYVQETGSGGESQVRIRGGMPEQVLVLVDGQRLNGSGSGLADLSAIPLETVEAIEIYKGGASAEFGPGAMAGAVNIVTRPKNPDEDISYRADLMRGAWDNRQYRLTLLNPLPLNGLTTRFSVSRKRLDGDFDFNYTTSGNGSYDTVHTGTRINNDMLSENLFLSTLYHITPDWYVNSSLQSYQSENGLPGRSTRQNEFARAEDNRLISSVALNYEKDMTSLLFEAGISRLYQHFVDTLTEQGALQYNSEFENLIYNLKHIQKYSLFSGNTLRFGAEYRRDIFDHADIHRLHLSMNRAVRENLGLSLKTEQYLELNPLPFFTHLNLTGKLRFDYSRTDKDSTSWIDTTDASEIDHVSPFIGAVIGGGEKINLSIRANYGKSFRLPELNALFWRGDMRSSGNPGLKPERSEHSEAGLDLKFSIGPAQFKTGITYFHSALTDMILWQPDFQGTWSPRNIASAKISGHEEYIELSLADRLLSLRYQNSVTDAINKTPGHNSLGKRLTLYPGYITRLSAKLDYKFIRAEYSIRFAGKVFTNSANTKYYDGYRIDDFSLGVEHSINHTWKFEAEFGIDNLGGTDYVLISNYAMPKKNWRFDFGVTFTPSVSTRDD